MAGVAKTGNVKSIMNIGGNHTVTMAFDDPPPPVDVVFESVPKTYVDDLRACKLAGHPVKIDYDDSTNTISGTKIE